MRKISKNDPVIVIAGKDKGTTSHVLRLVGKDRVVLENVNRVSKHLRARQAGAAEGIIQQEAPLHISNVAIFNQETGKKDSVGIREEDGKKVRYFKSTGELIEI